MLKMNTTPKIATKQAQNWLQIAYESTPKNELITKRDTICLLCECSTKTFYRWMQKGFIPRTSDLKIICNVFGLDFITRKALK